MSFAFSVDRSSPEPLYRQVERQLRDAIDAGLLRPGDRVPSVRTVASELRVGRLTVATAYEQLAADGYLVGRVGFGTIVAPTVPTLRTAEPARRPGPPAQQQRPGPPRREPARRAPIQPPPPLARAPDGARFDLRPGAPAAAGMSAGPALERLLREAWRELSGRGAGVEPAGDPLLRAAIAAHVRAARGGRCDASQVVVLSSALIGMAAVARLWLAVDRTVAVEDPLDPAFRRSLELADARLLPVPIDRHGLRVDALPGRAAVTLVGTRVHAITGAQMPLARRVGFLRWASTSGAIVVEDARWDDLLLAPAGPALQGIDDDGRVLHLGGFGGLLHPGMQLGYAVVPSDLVTQFTAAVAALDSGATPVQQRALGRFLADGHLDRHLARVRRSLADRFDATVAALRLDLGWLVSAEPPAGGTRLVVTIEDDELTATEAAEAAATVGVAIHPLSATRIAPGADRELVVDVAGHEPAELARAIHLFAGAVTEARRGRDGAHWRATGPGQGPRQGLRHNPSTRPPQEPPTRPPHASHGSPPLAERVAPIPRRWPAVTRSADRHHREARPAGAPRAARQG